MKKVFITSMPVCFISDWSDEEPSDTDIDSSEQEEDEEDQANESFI